MSRIATRQIKLPANVDAFLRGEIIIIKGPKGELESTKLKEVVIKITDRIITTVAKNKKSKFSYAMAGTANSLITSMIKGVTEGYQKTLLISGVGYRAALKGDAISLNLGLSYILEMKIPKGITVNIPIPTRIVISGIDKLQVTQFAAQIRAKRKAEPYKGKGIRYADEEIIRKEGKKVGK